MDIRPATEQDRAGIICLLRESLGESTIPKSEGLWAWKHEQNPFGKSFVLLAEEAGALIGVRAFMQWAWKWKGTVFNAIRAVDTATHPAHQGKGIFKKLTLQQAEACRQQGIHFVFNSPNAQSLPGYLKMGWVAQGKLPLKVKLLHPLSLAISRFSKKAEVAMPAEDPTPHQEWGPEVMGPLKHLAENDERLTTCLSPEYVCWRYAANPLFRYNHFTDGQNFLLVTRIKAYPFARELRLVDFMLLRQDVDPRMVAPVIQSWIQQFCHLEDVDFISISGMQYQQNRRFFRWMGLLPIRPMGPVITLKNLNLNGEFNDLLRPANWAYSLGDMELF